MATYAQAKRAQEKVIKETVKDIPNAAVGISRLEGSYCVAIRLQTEVAPGTLPSEVDGVPLDVKVIGKVIAY